MNIHLVALTEKMNVKESLLLLMASCWLTARTCGKVLVGHSRRGPWIRAAYLLAPGKQKDTRRKVAKDRCLCMAWPSAIYLFQLGPTSH